LPKYFTTFLLALSLIIFFGCQKELDPNLENEVTIVQKRALEDCSSSLQMDVKTTTLAKPAISTDTLCKLDLLHYIKLFEQYTFSTCVTSDDRTCISIHYDNSWRNNLRGITPPRGGYVLTNDYLDRPSKIDICNEIMSIQTESGQSFSYSTDMSSSFLGSLQLDMFTNSVTHTELENLIFENNPGDVQIKNNYYVITSVNGDGTTTKTYIDILNGMIRYAETIGSNGETIDKIIYEYICLDGTLFPKSIIDIVLKVTPHCNTEILDIKTTVFSNHQVQ